MPRLLLDGREIAGFIKQRHFEQVKRMRVKPTLAIVQAGDDPASNTYIRVKRRYGEDIGVRVEHHRVAPDLESLLQQIDLLNNDPNVHGIIVQLPLPGSASNDTEEVLNRVAPEKDVDGLANDSRFDPATPAAIIWLLASYDIVIRDATVTVVGRGRLVGAPLAKMLEDSGAHVIRCDQTTTDLASQTLKADVIISGTGRPNLITTGMVKPGATIVDAGGGHRDGKLAGDVNPALFENSSLAITPNPGGVGPMTVATLFEHTLQAAKNA
jgi:methylenetetrahydrofolate dehydrogenase (NADP+)/methenyltetrahydrofolate cyclohydrolase